MMKIKQSPLKFEEFYILDSHFQTLNTNDIQKITIENIPIDIDFDILLNEKENDLFNIVLILNGNIKEKPEYGYRFTIISNGIFRLKDLDNLDINIANQFIYFSALPILINSIRTYLLNISSFAPFGKYLLPAIDLKDLLKKREKKERGDR